ASIALEIRIMRSQAFEHFRGHIESIGFDADDRLHRFEGREPPVLVVGATSERQGEKTGDLRKGRYPPSGGQNINFSLHAAVPCGHETLDSERRPGQPDRYSKERTLVASCGSREPSASPRQRPQAEMGDESS